MKSYKIYLIRHEMTEANEHGVYLGQTDVPLSPEGLRHLLDMKEAFDYPPVTPVTKLFAAPLSRCLQTLQVLYPKADVITLEGLNECSLGEWEGKTVTQLKTQPGFAEWVSGQSGAIPGGEDAESFQTRVSEAFEQLVEYLMRSGSTEAVVCVPGGVMMLIMAKYAFPRASMGEWATDAACGFEVRVTPELWMREPVMEAVSLIPWNKEEESDDESRL